MRMTPGEVMDRWTILRMKARIAPEMTSELSRYAAEAHSLLDRGASEGTLTPLRGHLLSLMEANAKIWVLEGEIRGGDDLPLDEVGRRALRIRDFNRFRVEAKGAIDRLFGETPDVKVDHASEARDGTNGN